MSGAELVKGAADGQARLVVRWHTPAVSSGRETRRLI
jgi:hypothetical protein